MNPYIVMKKKYLLEKHKPIIEYFKGRCKYLPDANIKKLLKQKDGDFV